MGFNSQVQNMQKSGGGSGIFKNGVNYKYCGGSNPIAFRIAPAFNYVQDAEGNRVPESPSSYLPFRFENGEFSDWGAVVYVARGLGHGADFRSRSELVSLKTFDETAACPLETLYNAARQMPEWNYLIKDETGPDGKSTIRRAPMSRVSPLLLMNIVDVGDPQRSDAIQLGIFSKSASDSLFADNGIAVAPGMAPPEQIEQNYLLRWAYGDITDPQYGPVLLLSQVKDGRKYSSYKITLAMDAANSVKRWPLNETMLAKRYDLGNIRSIINEPTQEALVTELCSIFNMRSPSGIHEWALLRELFGNIANIPEPPAAPAGTPTVQAGFTPPSAPAGAPAFGPQPTPAPVAPPAAPQAPAAPAAPQEPAAPPPQAGPTPPPAVNTVAANAAVPPSAPPATPAAGSINKVANDDVVPGTNQTKAEFLASLKNMKEG